MKIEGVPEGYEIVRIGVPKAGEFAVDTHGQPLEFLEASRVGGYAIIREVPPPKPAINPGEGWRLLEKGEKIISGDEVYLNCLWQESYIVGEIVNEAVIRRRIAPKYRPFANAEEFMPHRDKWIKSNSEEDDSGEVLRAVIYNDSYVFFNSDDGESYQALFSKFVFEDGTPCGVKE